ncbi:MAG: ABC transporter ATP-binding protein [Acidimicrobiia bacterium]|nr:ABC transporter ATP-binding protein [Acidimicrobiia bacterium]
MAAIEIRDLRKTYRSRRGPVAALDGLDLDVPEGGVFAFLGANGAGKTTTIRALVGHLRATGSVRVLGAEVPRELPKVIDRIGALVEQPSFFPGFSGHRNLSLLARARGLPQARVDAVLEQVGLTARAASRAATYSLGMKQRLGVAAALLKEPAMLILDEPANGLDPEGIKEMRELLRRLGDEGRTVFVSSHILGEVQQLSDRVAIVHAGRCIATGSVDDLLSAGPSKFRVRVPGDTHETHLAAAVLEQAGFSVWADPHGEMAVDVTPDDSWRVAKVLADAAVYVAELSPIERTLEQAFLEITGGASQIAARVPEVGSEPGVAVEAAPEARAGAEGGGVDGNDGDGAQEPVTDVLDYYGGPASADATGRDEEPDAGRGTSGPGSGEVGA